MPYALRFDGVDDRVTIASAMTGDAGTSAYSFRVKSGPNGITLPAAAGFTGFVNQSASGINGVVLLGTGAVRVYASNANRYGTAAGFIVSGAPFDFTIDHQAGGAFTITNNLTSTVVASGTFSTSTTFGNLTVFGRANTGSSEFLNGEIALIAVTGLANAQTWDADLSGGSGSILPTVSGTNQGTLNNFSVPSCWVFYSSGASNYTDTLLAGSYAHSGSLLNSSVGYSSALQAGSYSHSGSVLSSAVGYSSSLQGGAFSYSGSELQSIIQNGTQNYSDTLLGGSFTHAGSALQSAIARNSALLAGSYLHEGSSLSASLAFYSTLNGGSYSYFGSMLQSTVSGQVTVSIEGYTITFAADDVSGAFAADTVAATFINDYVSATWSN